MLVKGRRGEGGGGDRDKVCRDTAGRTKIKWRASYCFTLKGSVYNKL